MTIDMILGSLLILLGLTLYCIGWFYLMSVIERRYPLTLTEQIGRYAVAVILMFVALTDLLSRGIHIIRTGVL